MERRELALVTGGSRGIGRAVALRLAGMNMDIVFSYREGKAAADETAALIEKQGVRALAVQADAANREDCDRLVEEAYRFGEKRIDVLVNNAGITRDNLILKMSDEQFEEVIQTNLTGVFYLLRAVSKIMLKQKYGRIVNISSVAGVRGNAGQIDKDLGICESDDFDKLAMNLSQAEREAYEKAPVLAGAFFEVAEDQQDMVETHIVVADSESNQDDEDASYFL